MNLQRDVMLAACLMLTFAALSLALVLGFVRLARGPTLPDRVVALELMASLLVGFCALYAVATDQPVFLDVAMVLALTAFLGGVAFARYLETRAAAMNQIVAVSLLLLGAGLMLLAAVGLLRMPDLPTRMHATTKAGVLGAGLMLLGAAVFFGDLSVTARAIAIMVFIVITAPVAAHLIGRAAYFVGVPLWEKTVVDELKGRYDPQTHTLDSAVAGEANQDVGRGR